jgi:trans-2,3-dihydro-3-hydroxyanthranilate isomerase
MRACGATGGVVAPRPSPTTTQRRRTRTGTELSGCGHGTVVAQAVRLTRTALGELRDRQHTGGRTFDTVAIRRPVGIEVWFDQGLVALRHPAPDERAAIVAALGLTVDDLHPTDVPRIAAPGAPRMLVPVHDRSALFRVCPHLGRLAAACRRYGLDTTGSQAVAIEVEQGDTLGRPASVLASARRGSAGITTRVGGLAVVRDGR